jgi:hypothetical protein
VSRAAGLEVPAHERGVLSGGLVVPAHARVGGFGFGGLHVVGGRFGCNSSVALGPAWRRSFRYSAACPLVSLSVVVSAKVVR